MHLYNSEATATHRSNLREYAVKSLHLITMRLTVMLFRLDARTEAGDEPAEVVDLVDLATHGAEADAAIACLTRHTHYLCNCWCQNRVERNYENAGLFA